MRTVGWSLFLACSWTWCIGMYLPIIVLRDYGWWGFLVFSLPNVIGCAAFGYVLRNRSGSERFLARHAGAARAFSLITIAFHMFFVPMLLMERYSGLWIGALWPTAAVAAVLVFLVGLGLAQLGSSAWLRLATLLYAASLVMLIATLAGGGFSFEMPHPQAHPTWHLYFLALASCFGFALCPYLDLTFHRALRESPSRHSFLGFGLTFAVMIVFTAVYFITGFTTLILIHILAQAVFTVGVHLREIAFGADSLRSVEPKAPGLVAKLTQLAAVRALPRSHFWAALLPAAALLFALPLGSTGEREFVYQSFMVFYGLVFPSYVFLFALPRPICALTQRGLSHGLLFVLVSLPAFYLAFIKHEPRLLVYPFVILGVWWLLQRGRPVGAA